MVVCLNIVFVRVLLMILQMEFNPIEMVGIFLYVDVICFMGL
jgi:hypothetical protein